MAGKTRLYTPEIAETILERLADGEGLIAICKDEGMPSDGAVRYWVEADTHGFSARYASARARGIERLADEILEISDDGRNDTYRDDEGNVRTDYDVVNRSKLRVDSRKWLLSKLLPKQFGERLDLNHSGEVGIKDVPDEGLAARAEALLKQAQGTGEP